MPHLNQGHSKIPVHTHGDGFNSFDQLSLATALHHLVLVPSIGLWPRLVMRKEEIVTLDHEIEREDILNRYIREPKPFKKMIKADYDQ